MFTPRDREAARSRLYLTGLRLALFVGRLQAHKGPDVAIRTIAEAIARDPTTRATSNSRSSAVRAAARSGRSPGCMELATALGIADRVMFFPPQPQERLADFYAAADVVLVPSRSESFGLVALEAQACGTPVVAARVGGLPFVVDDGATGFLVDGHDPRRHAARCSRCCATTCCKRASARRRVPRAAVHVGRDRRRGARAYANCYREHVAAA